MSRYDLISEDYERFRIEYPTEFLNFITKKFTLDNSKVYCDLGCGTGKFAKKIVNSSKRVDGVDLSSGMLKVANNIGNGFVPICADANKFLKSETYDAVFISHSFHWMNPTTVLKNTCTNLKNNGYIAIFWNNSLDRNKQYYKQIQELVRKFHSKPISEHRGKNTLVQLKDSKLFSNINHKEFFFEIEYTVDEYLGLLKSKSYVSDDIPKEYHEEFFKTAKKILLNEGRTIKERFVTNLYYGQKITF
jgi:SAM-dependent methyltransferase